MSNEKHYPTHPGAEHPPIMTFEIPLEEYESLKRENERLTIDKRNAELRADVADATIVELKAKLQDHCIHCPVKEQEDDVVSDLKAKLESVQATAYAESVDAGMENRRLKRALWLARANRALEKIAWFKLWNTCISTMNPEDGARQEFDKWKKNLGKFLKKAEEYK